MRTIHNKITFATITLLAFAFCANSYAEDDVLIIEDEDNEILIIDDAGDDDLLELTEDHAEDGGETLIIIDTNEDDELLIIEEDPSGSAEIEVADELELEDEDADLLAVPDTNEPDTDEGEEASANQATALSTAPDASPGAPTFKIDRLWVEYGHFTKSNSAKNNQGYGHGLAIFEWSPSSQWELKASARADGYFETGRDDWSDIGLDYDETYIRYKAEKSTITVGAQKILWGRIDEFPPTDRLSTQDIRRFIIDDLEDRRLASLALRLEHFFDNKKLDLVFYPDFREAQLPDKDSTWYPVNRQSGEILGLKTNAAQESVVKNASIKENPPDSEGGFGLRFSGIGSTLDYALSIQKGRQTLPYFRYNPATNTIEGEYPRTWIVGGDVGFEGLGGTVKFETTWLSDTPVTRKNGTYTTVESVNWGTALELFPGDGDSRLNLQLTGTKLIDAPSVMDRAESYAFNGTYEVPFDDNRWRAKTRFNVGLDEKDIYLNPEIAFTGWESQEVYLEWHFFSGAKGTPGGFYEDNSIVALGWRITL